MRVLFASSWLPFPPNNGSKLRIYNLLRGLARHHEVHLIAFADQPDTNPAAPELRALCRTIQVVPLRVYRPTSARSLLGLFSPTPRSIVDTYSPAMFETISTTVHREGFDVVIASELTTAAYWEAFHGLPALIDDLEIGILESHVAEAASSLQRLRHRLTQLKQRAYLRRLLSNFVACTVVSENERALVHRAAPAFGPVEVIPNCVNLADYRNIVAEPQPDSLIFTGSFRYYANHDAMCWFLKEVYPRIQAQSPAVRLAITGDHANCSLPSARGVTLTGFVEDVRPLIAAARVSVVPLRLGGGTRLKILEAMALGTPVVSTTKGAEGLEVEHGLHLLMADTPAEFAAAVLRLLREPGLRDFLVSQARQRVAEHYDWAVIAPRFWDVVNQVARQAAAPAEGSCVDA